MRHQVLVSLGALAAVIAVVSLAPRPVAGQTPTTAPKTVAAAKTATTWTPPRTPWGDPDLQGIYTNKNFNGQMGMSLERPREFGERQFLTDEEYAKRLEQARKTLLDDPEERGNDVDGDKLRAPLFWHERGNPSRRTSLIVDPPDGRIPPLTPEAQKRVEARPRLNVKEDSWEDRSLHMRCITRSVPGSMMPSQYGNAYQILQTRDYVAIRYEMDHETRMIPLDGRPHAGPAIRTYMGDARGHWEGTTLVVETTNFNDKPNMERDLHFRGSTENLRVIERFTRVDADTVEWKVTIEDPTTWTRPWTFMVPLTSKPEKVQGGLQATSKIWVFEYECHEGNYGVLNMLSAARNLEKAEEAAKKK